MTNKSEHCLSVIADPSGLAWQQQQSEQTRQLTCVDDLSTPLEQQQLIKGLKDINEWLVGGAHYDAACVDNVAQSPHATGCCSCIHWMEGFFFNPAHAMYERLILTKHSVTVHDATKQLTTYCNMSNISNATSVCSISMTSRALLTV